MDSSGSRPTIRLATLLQPLKPTATKGEFPFPLCYDWNPDPHQDWEAPGRSDSSSPARGPVDVPHASRRRMDCSLILHAILSLCKSSVSTFFFEFCCRLVITFFPFVGLFCHRCWLRISFHLPSSTVLDYRCAVFLDTTPVIPSLHHLFTTSPPQRNQQSPFP